MFPDSYRNGGGTISNYSSFGQLRQLMGQLSEAEKAVLRTTVFGHLLDIPNDQNWCGPLFNFMFSRLIKAEPARTEDGEMWFRIFDMEICFTKREYAAISGLSIRKPDTPFVPPTKVSRLMDEYFSTDKKIDGKALLIFLETTVAEDAKQVVKEGEATKQIRKVNAEDRAKVVLLWVVQRFVYGYLPEVKVVGEAWYLVDNIEEFNKFPWGEKSYEIFHKKTLQAYAKFAKNKPAVPFPNVKPQGMAQVLVVRVFLTLRLFPHLLRVQGCL